MSKPDYSEFQELIAKRKPGRRSSTTSSEPFSIEIDQLLPLRELQARYIFMVLKHFGGNRQKTTKALGISIRALRYYLSSWRDQIDTGK